MRRFSSLRLLLAGIVFLCSEPSFAGDVHGCFKLQAALRQEHGLATSIYYNYWFPRCLAGGYYENVQCDFRGCFCAYVDTGNKIPNTMQDVGMEYLRENCPWLPEKEPDACAVPPIDYPCKKKMRKFFYNSDTGNCVETTNGCLGFDTARACEDSCVVQKKNRCNFKLARGRTCERRGRGIRWYHDENLGTCRPFLHEGCDGNSNNYREKWICLKTCEVELNTDLIIQVGNTKYIISLPTWLVVRKLYVPSASNNISVEEFKDLEGYKVEISRFPVKEEEHDKEEENGNLEFEKYRPEHAPKNMSRKELCSKPKEPGPCRGWFPSWQFDKMQSKCVKFVYGGCLGNENRHLTATGCAVFCNAEIPPTEADIIDDIISSGGTIEDHFGLLKEDKKDVDDASERKLNIGPPIPDTGDLGSEEVDFIFEEDDEEPDDTKPTETTTTTAETTTEK